MVVAFRLLKESNKNGDFGLVFNFDSDAHRCRLLWGWLQDEVEVDLPVVAKSVVGVALDLPSARIAGRLGVTAPYPDVDILECHISQPVVFR